MQKPMNMEFYCLKYLLTANGVQQMEAIPGQFARPG